MAKKQMNNYQHSSDQSSEPTRQQQHMSSNIQSSRATAVADKPAVKQTKKTAAPTYEQIAERARSIWQERGCPTNQDESIWYEAENQLKREHDMY
jgi:hypothetical protein